MRELLNGQLITHTGRPARDDGDNWLPVVDGDVVPAAPFSLLAERKLANVSAIIGWTENDAVLFTPTDIATPHQTYHFARAYPPGFTEANIEKLLELYASSDLHHTYFKNGSLKLPGEFYRTGRIF